MALNVLRRNEMLIALDYDGVIADSFDRILSFITIAQSRIGVGRVPIADDLRLIPNLTFSDVANRIGIPSERLSEFASIALDLQSTSEEVPNIFPGIRDVIHDLANDHDLVIISSSAAVEIERFLQHHSLHQFVRRVADGVDRRPKRDKLASLMDEFRSPPPQTYMVGDSRSDVVEARAAGAKTIAVTWGFQPRDVLSTGEPDFIVSSPEELLMILRPA